MSIRIKASLAAIICLCACSLFANTRPPATETKSKLKQLDSKIQQLRQSLTSAHDKHGLLNRELADNEKRIGSGIQELRELQQNLNSRQQQITRLQQQVKNLSRQLARQQALLVEHIRIRYKMGEYQPVKWVLNQDAPGSIHRLLTYHQYLVRARLDLMGNIRANQKNLILAQNRLKTGISTLNALQEKRTLNQQQLEHYKQYHTAVIHSLDNEIQSKEQALSEFERNRKNLSSLLTSLASHTTTSTNKPFVQMHRKLPKPIQGAGRSFQKMNQGVTFFAGEGTPVYAVYPGKIVFSDWLNGYGLLLIIDHGQGFMTLYAHNQSLFKHKGNTVAQGEHIAAVGHSGGIKQSGLYFEVRQRGKAVPPLEWIV